MPSPKRIVSIFLAFALLCIFLPQTSLPVHAESYSGTCGEEGDNLTWQLDTATGLLTINGSGEMDDYNNEDHFAPWYAYRDQITDLSIQDGVTAIGAYAFYAIPDLSSVSIAEGITFVGSWAFADCTGLSSVTLPGSLRYPGDYSFSGCSGLTSLTLTEGIGEIAHNMFSGCTGLTAVTIPESMRYISGDAFAGCDNLTSLTVLTPDSYISYNSPFTLGDPEKTVLYGYDDTTVQSYAQSYGYTFVSLGPAPSHFSGSCGADGDNLTWELDTQTGLLAISGSGAMADYNIYADRYSPWYRYRSKIAVLSLPEGLTTISEFAFADCDNLTVMPVPKNVASIEISAFVGCYSLGAYDVSPENAVYSGDSCGVLFNKDKTELILYPMGREGEYSVPDGVITIMNRAFFECNGLTSVSLPASLTTIYDSAFELCQYLTSVQIPESVTSIGSYAFDCCWNLKSVVIPNGITCIERATFMSCSSLSSVTIPDSVRRIDSLAFVSCHSLAEITIPEGVSQIGDRAFCDSGLNSITIPESVSIIEHGAFSLCMELHSVWIKNSDCQIEDIEYDSGSALGSPEYTVLYASIGSTTEAYANKYGYVFCSWIPAFSDVSVDAYYAEPVQWAFTRGITAGVGSGIFDPASTCSRAQIVTLLWRAAGSPDTTLTESPFTDVWDPEVYYYTAVLWAYEKGITTGIRNTTFGANQGCTRAQVVTMLWRMARSPEPETPDSTFVDVQNSDLWYYKAVLWAAENSITKGTAPNVFTPDQTCSRAQMVTFLYQYCTQYDTKD